jgi:hypothetical protein
VSGLRSFLKFLHIHSYIARPLVDAVPIIHIPREDRVPRGVPWPDIERLLTVPDRATERGRHGYALPSLRIQGEISHLHVFGHALPKGCHRKLLREMELLQAATPCFRIGRTESSGGNQRGYRINKPRPDDERIVLRE